MRCVACEFRWQPEEVDRPGKCPSCEQKASTVERCGQCPVVEVQHYRSLSWTGQLLERVLEHEFDCKHYKIDPGEVNADVREGLKVLESERLRWERERREQADQEREEKTRVMEMQRQRRF